MYSTSSLGGLRSSEPRRGLILMVVLALLTAFAIVGLSFVLYADAEAKAAQIARESEQGLTVHPYDVEPKALLSSFLGQLIFDADDDLQTNSAFRGHSLARSMYGYNYDTTTKLPLSNTQPFNGLGRVHSQMPATTPFSGQDEFMMVNYKAFASDVFIRDPERPGVRVGTTKAAWLGGFNAPYTYADANNMCLAVVDSSGNVLQPSYFRQSIFNAPLNSTTPTTDNWSTPLGKYLILRPRPTDNAGFPYPEDGGGDVKNLLGNPGGNDSMWVDGGSPVRLAANGKNYKAMFAPLVVELDSRINVSVHGNIMGRDTSGNVLHISNTGWGPWSVNLGQVLKDYGSTPSATNEWMQLFSGSGTNFTGRYGSDKLPGNGGTVSTSFPFTAGSPGAFPSFASHSYALMNFDEGVSTGSGVNTVRTQLTNSFKSPMTPSGTNPNYYPTYASGYSNSVGVPQLTNHALAYDAFGIKAGVSDRVFPPGSMESLLRFNDTTSYSLTGDLLNLCPNTFTQQQRPRNMVTTRAFDVDAPGLSPAFLRTGGTYLLNSVRPQATAPAFPNAASILAATNTNSDFLNKDGRMSFAMASAIDILSRRLDLNRPLPDYPALNLGGSSSPMSVTDPKFLAAQQARQDLAKDIFDRLRLITGASDDLTTLPGASTSSIPNKDALRWLAQLSVNIVDFIDNDDIMTPFTWAAPGGVPDIVYGTEVPRLLINEVLAQYKNAPNPSTDQFVDVFVELMNPSNSDTSLLDSGNAHLIFPSGSSPPSYNPYQLTICKNIGVGTAFTTLTAAGNTTGIPDSNYISTQPLSASSPTTIIQVTTPGGSTACQVTDFSAFTSGPVPGAVPPYAGGTGATNSFLLIGNSSGPTLSASVTLGSTATMDISTTAMSYKLTKGTPVVPPNAPTILLQRLACPYIPPSATNPYVAVDIFQSACHDSSNLGINPNNDVTNTSANDASDGRVNPFMDTINTGSFTRVGENSHPAGSTVFHSFKALNKNEKSSNNQWLVHLDRYLSSPMELLHVSGFKPEELTHYFGDTPTGPLGQYGHRVPWFDEDLISSAGTTSHLLYRLFELIETRSHMAGMEPVVFQTLPNNGTIAANATVIPLQSLFASGDNGSLVKIAAGDVLTVIGVDSGNKPIMENIRVSGLNASPLGITLAKGNNGITINQSFSNAFLVHTATGGRVAGKINVNNVFDREIFRALCDQNAANAFQTTDVETIYSSINSAIHQPGGTTMPDAPAVGIWTNPQNDQPFLGMGMAQLQFSTTPSPTDLLQLTTANGESRTFFRSVPSGTGAAGIFEPASASGPTFHPYLRYELLNKVFNNMTSRSNVFAVWLTVGFFECDANGNNLGQEIGKAEGKSVRHRMFAIVDRTGLAVPRPAATLSANVAANASAQAVNLSSTSGITVGTNLLVVTPGSTNQASTTEVVTVTGVSATQISATFTLAHNQSDTVYIMPGFWGPQPGFDVTQPVNSQIVPYFSIIE